MKRKGLSALEYLKEKSEATEYHKNHSQYDVPLSDLQRKYALEHACRKCHAVRSPYEVLNGFCSNCD